MQLRVVDQSARGALTPRARASSPAPKFVRQDTSVVRDERDTPNQGRCFPFQQCNIGTPNHAASSRMPVPNPVGRLVWLNHFGVHEFGCRWVGTACSPNARPRDVGQPSWKCRRTQPSCLPLWWPPDRSATAEQHKRIPGIRTEAGHHLSELKHARE
jgi:hypothetical protein